MPRPPRGRRVLRAKRPHAPPAGQRIPAPLAECLQRLQCLPNHLRDYILALAVSWVVASMRLLWRQLGAGRSAASAAAELCC